jgi:hypothetical protein
MNQTYGKDECVKHGKKHGDMLLEACQPGSGSMAEELRFCCLRCVLRLWNERLKNVDLIGSRDIRVSEKGTMMLQKK